MSKKIYCQNCRWYKSGIDEFHPGCYVVLSPLISYRARDHKGQYRFFLHNKDLLIKLFKPFYSESMINNSLEKGDLYDQECHLNDDYNCPCYQRRWWKFWVSNQKPDVVKLGVESL